MLALTFREKALLKKLSTPSKVQDFVNSIPFNFEKNKIDTLKSPVRVLRENNAHCFEGAILAAYILSLHGRKPLVMYLQSTKKDFDHVVAPFKQHGGWGAISKTNHGVLRYREPIYKTIRELAASYFHEYFLDTGEKTLRRYTEPLDLNAFDDNWMFEEGDLWGIDQALDKARHYDLISKEAVKTLRKADPVERQAGKLTEWK